MQGKHLTISIVPYESSPFMVYTDEHENKLGNEKFEGMLVDLLNSLSEDLGFNFDLKPAADNRYGKKIDGVWTGMIGEVER